MRKPVNLTNDAVIAVSERKKHLLPLALIITGSIWLIALAFQWTISLGVVWVLGGDHDFGKVPQGKNLRTPSAFVQSPHLPNSSAI